MFYTLGVTFAASLKVGPYNACFPLIFDKGSTMFMPRCRLHYSICALEKSGWMANVLHLETGRCPDKPSEISDKAENMTTHFLSMVSPYEHIIPMLTTPSVLSPTQKVLTL